MADNILLTFYLALAGLISNVYYRWLLPAEELKRRLPNRISPSGILLAVVLIVVGIFIWQQDSGWLRFRRFLPMIFNLLLFETFLIFLMRWIKQTLVAVIISLALATSAWFLQQEFRTVVVYNATFILAPLGAAALLIRLGYWRSRMILVVAGLWTIYDILASQIIYPVIFKPAAIPSPSFLFPAVIAGQRTLGSGDFMFLTIFTLALIRSSGLRAAWIHVAIQAVALLITVSLKSPEVQFPYLTVMTPLFVLVWWTSRRRTSRRFNIPQRQEPRS